MVVFCQFNDEFYGSEVFTGFIQHMHSTYQLALIFLFCSYCYFGIEMVAFTDSDVPKIGQFKDEVRVYLV